MIKVNIGAGHSPMPASEGWRNFDIWPTNGVEYGDIEERLPFEDGTVDYILAKHVLEHVIRFDKAWNEITRLLKIGGRIMVQVPYGYNANPYHIRYFDRTSVYQLTHEANACGNEWGYHYELVGKPKISYTGSFPWWHLQKHLHWQAPALFSFRAIHWNRQITFTLERVT